MTTKLAMAASIATAVTAAALAVVLSPGSSSSPTPRPAAASMDGRRTSATRFRGGREDCATRSEASFPGAYTSPANLVVGPLALIGGAYTDARTVRDFGGDKFPLLVKAGHTVTVRVARRDRPPSGLAYGLLPPGKTTVRDTHRSVTFVACRPGKAPQRYSPEGPSASDADGLAVTFWSGFVLTAAPACIPLDVYVDDAPSARRVGLSLGRRCDH